MRTVLGKITSSMQAEKVSSRLGLLSGMRSCLTLKASGIHFNLAAIA